MRGKKGFLIRGSIAFISFLAVYFLFIWPVKKQCALYHADVLNRSAALRTFFTRPGGPPKNSDIKTLAAENKILYEKYRLIEKKFISEKNKETDISPLAFGKLVHETRKKLMLKAERAGIKIPDDLGFKDTLPSSEEVKDMVKQLYSIEYIIGEAASLRFGDITKIQHRSVSVETPWEKIGVELELRGKFHDIINFLIHISRQDNIYIIKTLEIKKVEKNILSQIKDYVRVRIALESCKYIGRNAD